MKRLILLGVLLGGVCAFNASLPGSSSAEAYQCRPGVRYCQQSSQCRGFCGPGVPAQWEICFQGCCTCAG
jgi:hypothetical protein